MAASTIEKPEKKSKNRLLYRLIWLLLVVFIVIQFLQPDKNNNEKLETAAIGQVFTIPDTVQTILTKACYDCHSNNTQYPWYTNIQPVGWWLKNHIDAGKAELNFSEFANMEAKGEMSKKAQQQKMLETIKEQIETDQMPLASYKLIHKEARLTAKEKKILMIWASSASYKISKAK